MKYKVTVEQYHEEPVLQQEWKQLWNDDIFEKLDPRPKSQYGYAEREEVNKEWEQVFEQQLDELDLGELVVTINKQAKGGTP